MKQDKNLKNIKNESSRSQDGIWSFKEDIYSSIDGTDAVVILTEWTEYSKINWSEVCKTMRKPSWIFDTRSSISDHTLRTIKKFDLNIWRIGDGSEHNFK